MEFEMPSLKKPVVNDWKKTKAKPMKWVYFGIMGNLK